MPKLITEPLRKGWKLARIADLVERVDAINPRDEPDERFTYVEIGSIDSGTKTVTSTRSIQGATAPTRARQRILPDDVLVSTVRPKLGAVAMVPDIGNGVATTALCVLRAREDVLARYLFFVVQSPGFRSNLVDLERGATYPAVGIRDVLGQYVLVPPLEDQELIVSELDALLFDLAALIQQSVRDVAALAKQREELIQAAVSGQVQDWGKATHKSLSRANASVGTSNNLPSDGARGYRTVDGRPVELPPSWRWVAIDDIGELTSGLTLGPSRSSSDQAHVPYLRVANVQRGSLDLAEIRTTPASEREIEDHRLREGDVLFAAGGDLDKLGRGWVWQNELPECLHQNHIFRLRLADQELRPEFISHFCNAFGAQWIQSRARRATNLASVGIKAMREMPVPMPPIPEMRRIDDSLRLALSAIDQKATELAATRAALRSKRESWIEAAVSGQRFPSRLTPSMIETAVKENEASIEQHDALSRRMRPERHRTLESALQAADGWIDARAAFTNCGVVEGTDTTRIEALYAELRLLVAGGRVGVLSETDAAGRKLFDRLRWEGPQT